MATLLPRMERIRCSDSPITSVPSTRIEPSIRDDFRSCRPRTAMLDTDLPEPDSPTMPSVLPSSRE